MKKNDGASRPQKDYCMMAKEVERSLWHETGLLTLLKA